MLKQRRKNNCLVWPDQLGEHHKCSIEDWSSHSSTHLSEPHCCCCHLLSLSLSLSLSSLSLPATALYSLIYCSHFLSLWLFPQSHFSFTLFYFLFVSISLIAFCGRMHGSIHTENMFICIDGSHGWSLASCLAKKKKNLLTTCPTNFVGLRSAPFVENPHFLGFQLFNRWQCKNCSLTVQMCACSITYEIITSLHFWKSGSMWH